MEPRLNDGVYVYCSLPPGSKISHIPALAVFHEQEGITLIVEEGAARRAALPIIFRAAWITLTVNSELDAVGLTAAFSSALAGAGISCNAVAAARHDHIFVPVESAERALKVLRDLQQGEA